MTDSPVGTVSHGLYLPRPRTCPCGATFRARTPTATYCSVSCRVVYTRYGNPGVLKERTA